MRVRYPSPEARPAAARARGAALALAALRCAFGLAVLALLLSPLAAHAQAAYEPEFDADVVGTRGAEGAPQVDVYTAVPFQNLRFLARTGGFEATYTVTVGAYRADEQGRRQGLAGSRSWERAVTVGSYAETQGQDTTDLALQSLALTPGRYLVEVVVEDGASRRSASRELAITVPDPASPFSLADPLVLERYEPGSRELHPTIGGVVRTDQGAFTLYYEIFSDREADLLVTYAATERAHRPERPSFRTLLGLSDREQEERGVPYLLSESIHVQPGRNPATLRIDADRFRVGDYTFQVQLEDAAGAVVAQAERPLTIRWMGLEGEIQDLEEAVAQLRYVARDNELRAMRGAATDEERLRLFRDFWTRRDPSPGTRRNERMEEYYFRVTYANERYSRLRDEGWSTDRGEVYIRFGEPDFVESHPFSYGTRPYEVWYYNSHGRRFIFVDDTGGGDYRLLVPIWDERNRM